jgi:lipopolysaccharide transport system permease protein
MRQYAGSLEAPSPVLRFDAATPQRLERAVQDLSLGLRRWRLAAALAWLDIRNRYRGSVLGPIWLTMSTAATFAALGLLYSTLFKIDLHDYMPFLAASLILWNMIAQIVGEGCTAFSSAEGVIRQVPLPFTVHALRCMLRNVIVAAHNLPLIFVVFLIFDTMPGAGALLALPGLALLLLSTFGAIGFLGMVCARFRDVGPIVGTVMQLAFFVSPVIWKPELLGPDRSWLLMVNPFYALLEVVRGPLLGAPPSLGVWALAVATTLVCVFGSMLFFVRFRGRIAFWV